jgi:hypothetical protein
LSAWRLLQLLLLGNTRITPVARLVGCVCENIARVGAVPRQLPLLDAARHGERVRKCGYCSRKRTGEATCLLLTALSRGCSSTSPAHHQNASAITICNNDTQASVNTTCRADNKIVTVPRSKTSSTCLLSRTRLLGATAASSPFSAWRAEWKVTYKSRCRSRKRAPPRTLTPLSRGASRRRGAACAPT